MKKSLLPFFFALTLVFIMIWPFASLHAAEDTRTAYDFTFHKLIGDEDLPLSQFKGKVILVVNTASHCGFTPQYQGLEKLYETYRDRGFVIVGVPSNDFGAQEPGTSGEIATFCKLNYGVSFPMASKENVVGDNAHPFYKWAKESLGVLSGPKWNFHKYLINRNGEIVDYFHSTTTPDSDRLISAVEKLLDEPSNQ
jgi:glutathione peroxidase